MLQSGPCTWLEEEDKYTCKLQFEYNIITKHEIDALSMKIYT